MIIESCLILFLIPSILHKLFIRDIFLLFWYDKNMLPRNVHYITTHNSMELIYNLFSEEMIKLIGGAMSCLIK